VGGSSTPLIALQDFLGRIWRTLIVCFLTSVDSCSDLCGAVDDDFIYEDEEEEEPDVDVENGYYNAKGTSPVHTSERRLTHFLQR